MITAGQIFRITGEPPEERTLLHIGNAQSTIQVVRPDRPPATWHMGVGVSLLAGRSSPPSPPTPLALEQAITDVEDALAPLARARPVWPPLIVLSEQAAAFAPYRIHTAGQGTIVPLEQIEHLFRDLAALSEGARLAADESLRRLDFAGVLLITREFMHHLGYREVRFAWDPAWTSEDMRGMDA